MRPLGAAALHPPVGGLHDAGRSSDHGSMDALRPTLSDLTGAELYSFEAHASEHGTPQELDAIRDELERRVNDVTPPSTARPATR